MEFNIGDKVLCIDGDNWSWWNKRSPYFGITTPKTGDIYTIRSTKNLGYDAGILLKEIKNKLYPFSGPDRMAEPKFIHHRFIKWNPEEETIEIKEKAEVTL
jgi:hypothetical protein